jgi:hypothetical protein
MKSEYDTSSGMELNGGQLRGPATNTACESSNDSIYSSQNKAMNDARLGLKWLKAELERQTPRASV